MGESDFPVEEAALFYSLRPPEELEEYTWVSQTYLRTWLLSPMPEANRGAEGINVGESNLYKDLAALSNARGKQRSWRNTHG